MHFDAWYMSLALESLPASQTSLPLDGLTQAATTCRATTPAMVASNESLARVLVSGLVLPSVVLPRQWIRHVASR